MRPEFLFFPHEPAFYVIQLFDQEGYHSHVSAESRENVIRLASRRSAHGGIVFVTRPFRGSWWRGLFGHRSKDISLPVDWVQDFPCHWVDRPVYA